MTLDLLDLKSICVIKRFREVEENLEKQVYFKVKLYLKTFPTLALNEERMKEEDIVLYFIYFLQFLYLFFHVILLILKIG